MNASNPSTVDICILSNSNHIFPPKAYILYSDVKYIFELFSFW